LEISQGVARHYSGEKDLEVRVGYASSSLYFTLFGHAIFLAFVFSCSQWLADELFNDTSAVTLVELGASFISAQSLFRLIQNQIRWDMKPVRYACVSFLQTLVGIGVSLYFVLEMEWGVCGLLCGQTLGMCVGICLGLVLSRGIYRLRFDWFLLKEMLRFSFPLVPAAVGTVVALYIDRLAIKELLTLEDVGIYGIAYRFAAPASLLIVGFQMALTPLVYHSHENPETPGKLASIFRYFLFLGLPVWVFAGFFAEEAIVLLTASKFHMASSVLPFLFAVALTSGMYVFAPGMGIAKKTKVIAGLTIFSACLNGLLNYILIPIFGLTGAAIATLLSTCVSMGGWFYFSHRLYPIPFEWFPIITAIAWTTLIVLVVPRLEFTGVMSLVVKTSVWVLFVLSLFLVGLLKISEIKLALSFVRLSRNA
jgi:O-antigen/teichoic acid export membrane protein